MPKQEMSAWTAWTGEFLLVCFCLGKTKSETKGVPTLPLPGPLAMSRCFPFPPPGYENKDRPHDASLLIKEKQKGKKHKKDKKDKDRKGKEKKHKDRGDEKHSEKKDRKDKHKHKEDRNKEKKRSSDEQKSMESSDSHNGQKLGPNCTKIDDTNFLLDLGKRIRDVDVAQENEAVQKIAAANKKHASLLGKVVESNIHTLAGGNESFKEKREDSRTDNGQSSKAETRSIRNGFAQNLTGGIQREAEGVVRMVNEDVEKGNGKNGDKHVGSGGDGFKDRNQYKKSQSKDKEGEKKKEKGKKVLETEPKKEKLKIRENGRTVTVIHNVNSDISKESNNNCGNEGNVGRRKRLEINGILHDKDIQPSKLPKLVSTHQVVENGKIFEPCQAGTQSTSGWEGKVKKNDMNNKVHLLMDSGMKSEPSQSGIQIASEWPRIVKNTEMTKVSSSHPVVECPRKLESCQAISQSASERQEVVGNHKVDYKEPRINGLIKTQHPNIGSMRPLSVPVKVKKHVEASVKPPHPDSTYLSQILSVPKIEWSDSDDQKWLFNHENCLVKKPELDASQVEGIKQVWAESMQIDSAGIIALPYVIPY